MAAGEYISMQSQREMFENQISIEREEMRVMPDIEEQELAQIFVNKGLDEGLTKFAQRRLTEAYPYLILDARYEKVREDGVIQSQAVLIAIGINWEGQRQVLGVELANRESHSTWREFLLGLKHGLDPDHLAAIDGLTRFNAARRPRLARQFDAAQHPRQFLLALPDAQHLYRTLGHARAFGLADAVMRMSLRGDLREQPLR